MVTLRDWLLELPARGQYTFTTADARTRQPDVSPAATVIALRCAADAGLIVTPVRGFHVVLPLEDRLAGSPSWRLFLDPLLRFLGLPYYVGLLTAAAHHGASAQAAQVVHVQLAMPAGREPEAEAFYAGLLGIPRVAKPANLERRGGCWFRSESVEIHLSVEEPFAPARKAHPALLVEDLDRLRERLVVSGFSVMADEPLEEHDRFHTSDPFGNRIEFLKALR